MDSVVVVVVVVVVTISETIFFALGFFSVFGGLVAFCIGNPFGKASKVRNVFFLDLS